MIPILPRAAPFPRGARLSFRVHCAAGLDFRGGMGYNRENGKFKLGFIGLFETYKQIKFVGTGVLDGPRIT